VATIGGLKTDLVGWGGALLTGTPVVPVMRVEGRGCTLVDGCDWLEEDVCRVSAICCLSRCSMTEVGDGFCWCWGY